jgi:hypothetical protein
MKYTIIRTKAGETTRETKISGDSHEVKSQAGKEFQAEKSLAYIQVLEENFSIVILQKDPATGKMINRFSA